MSPYVIVPLHLILFQDSTQVGGSIIPSIVFTGLVSGIVGALITLIGVGLQNRANRERQEAQLAADEKQRRIEREMALKRDIYLLGAESLGKMQSFLLSFANPLQDQSDRNRIVLGLNEALNKVAVIASLEMLEILEAVQSHYGKSALALGQKVELFWDLNSRLNSYISSVERIDEDLKEIRRQLQTPQLSGTSQMDLNERMGKATKLLNHLNTTIRDEQLEQVRLHSELVIESAEASVTFESLTADLNCLARVELGFDIDKVGYKKLIEHSGQRSRKMLAEYQSSQLEKYNNMILKERS